MSFYLVVNLSLMTVIAPGMELTLQNGELRIHGQFISAEQKEVSDIIDCFS